MKRWNWILGVGIVALLAGCVTGLGNGSSSGLDQLATEAATMGKADLQAMVTKYRALISEKVDVVSALKEKLKEIPLTEMMGGEATALKGKLSETTTLISQLKDKLSIYANALKMLK